jgi:hypothetical protein
MRLRAQNIHMTCLLIAIFWSGTTSSVFTAEFENSTACNVAGERYEKMIEADSQRWVSLFGRQANVAIVPTPASGSFICVPKG